ncbi:MAG TPA: hypothetical protein VF450_14645 [Noviherbaspirillum sp.]|jgi:hypothetical protein
MYIVAIAWIYVVLMMSITEQSVVAGVMTFLLYGLLPLALILYLMGVPERKRRRLRAEKAAAQATMDAGNRNERASGSAGNDLGAKAE